MLGATKWIFGGLQVAAVVVALAAVARGQLPKDLDRGSLNQLMVETTTYLDPQTTGSLRQLIETGSSVGRPLR
jgi:hypothetical protein